MEIREDKDFWETVKSYNDEIIPVFFDKFAKNNKLIQDFKNISNKKDKLIADFGCGAGSSFKYIKDFKKVYAVDFSKNMLEKAEKNSYEDFVLIEDDIKRVKLPEKVDIILAVSSVMPKNIGEFYITIDNFLNNLKKDGEIFLVLPSLEAKIFYYIILADFFFKKGEEPSSIYEKIVNLEKKENFNSFGYLLHKVGIIQKYWLKEEILFRLEKYNFSTISINKLELDWVEQMKIPNLKEYPKQWFWYLRIKK